MIHGTGDRTFLNNGSKIGPKMKPLDVVYTTGGFEVVHLRTDSVPGQRGRAKELARNRDR